MKRSKLVTGAVILVGLAMVMLLATTISDHLAGKKGLSALPPSSDLVQRGAYLARLGDCAACHSVPGRPPFTGGLAMAIPVGTIYTTNITFDRKDGIGTYSLSDFDRALRFGVSHGHTLYPAMPYPSYSNLKSEDVQALYAYFKYGVPASATPNIPNKLPFPLSMRFPLTMWRWAFAPTPAPFTPPPAMDAEVANGISWKAWVIAVNATRPVAWACKSRRKPREEAQPSCRARASRTGMPQAFAAWPRQTISATGAWMTWPSFFARAPTTTASCLVP
jgi:mono/diheme cytochrome c family protein